MAFSCFIKSVIAKSANREMKDAKTTINYDSRLPLEIAQKRSLAMTTF
jgi:hypothetical protein